MDNTRNKSYQPCTVYGKDIVQGKLIDKHPKFIKPFVKPKKMKVQYQGLELLKSIVQDEDKERNMAMEKTLLRLHQSIPIPEKSPKETPNNEPRLKSGNHIQTPKPTVEIDDGGKMKIAGEHLTEKVLPPCRGLTSRQKQAKQKKNKIILVRLDDQNNSSKPIAKPMINPKRPKILNSKERCFIEFTTTNPVERLLKTAFETELYHNRMDLYEQNKMKVTRQRIDGCLTRMLIKDRRNLLIASYANTFEKFLKKI